MSIAIKLCLLVLLSTHGLISLYATEIDSDEFSVPATTQSFINASSTTISNDSVEYSTVPIGSSFMRHLAHELNEDIKLLDKMEKRGFGRAETITLGLISKQSQKPLKELAKERLKEKTPLKTMAERAGINYTELYPSVQAIKRDIEIKGESGLPDPVFEKLPEKEKPKKKEKKKKKTEPVEGEQKTL